jgi:two-component sensor histidine kinase
MYKMNNSPLEDNISRFEVYSSIADTYVDVTVDSKHLIDFSVEKLANLTNDLAVICLFSNGGKNIDLKVSDHHNEIVKNEFQNLLKTYPINTSAGMIDQVIKTGLPLVVPVDEQNVSILSLLPQGYNTFLEKYSFSEIISLPIILNKDIIGTITLLRNHLDGSFNNDEQDFLQKIANLLASIIKNSRTNKEKELMLREMHHRIKNNLQVISSLLSMQSDYVKDEEAHRLFINSLNRIRSMSMIHENLQKDGNFSGVDIDKYLRDLVIYLFRSYNINTNLVKIDLNVGLPSMPVDTSITCGLLVNELISNSLKYAFPEGRSGNINLSLVSLSDKNKLIVSDNGVGIPESLNLESSLTFGFLLVNTLVDQLNGTIELIRTKGTKFIIKFPNNSE